ncbi:hypothetical protein [Pantoea sp. A4]|uniref:hypothetical protein n=1 Tax=Pantoea sp. A4 TaxID=1225184 RepID=UPI000AD0A8F5|nr:hypothetical protein [Pantoea sp. A4]
MSELCSLHSLWKNKQLPVGIPTLQVRTNWSKGIKLNPEHTGEIINITAAKVLIKSEKNQEVFHGEDKAMLGGINVFSLNDKVRFTPEASSAKYPNARNIVKL